MRHVSLRLPRRSFLFAFSRRVFVNKVVGVLAQAGTFQFLFAFSRRVFVNSRA